MREVKLVRLVLLTYQLATIQARKGKVDAALATLSRAQPYRQRYYQERQAQRERQAAL